MPKVVTLYGYVRQNWDGLGAGGTLLLSEMNLFHSTDSRSFGILQVSWVVDSCNIKDTPVCEPPSPPVVLPAPGDNWALLQDNVGHYAEAKFFVYQYFRFYATSEWYVTRVSGG